MSERKVEKKEVTEKKLMEDKKKVYEERERGKRVTERKTKKIK